MVQVADEGVGGGEWLREEVGRCVWLLVGRQWLRAVEVGEGREVGGPEHLGPVVSSREGEVWGLIDSVRMSVGSVEGLEQRTSPGAWPLPRVPWMSHTPVWSSNLAAGKIWTLLLWFQPC